MNLDTQKAKSNHKKITLSNSLRNKLIFTVSFIFILTTLTNYWLSFHRTKILNNEKASEYLVYLKDNLQVPLWNMDKDWVKSICQSFSNNEMIGLLKVTDGDGNILFHTDKRNEKNISSRKIELTFKNYPIGSIELGLSKILYKQQTQRMLIINVLTLALVIFGIAIATKMILNSILENPLNHLLKKIDNISNGEYEDSSQKFKHFEVITILEKFNHMSQRVKNREISLIKTNEQLESEIASRKKIEKAHKDSEQRYSQLVDNLTHGVFRSSPKPDGTFLMVNQALLNMLGYKDKDHFLKKSVSSIYKNPGKRRQFIELLLKQGNIQGFECEFVKKDGSTLVGLSSSQVSFDQNGKPLFIDGIIEDITQRKYLEQQMKQAQKMEALGTLAGGIAHDFNNILSSIFGFAEVAKLRYTSGKDVNDSLDEILSAGIRARGLIKQIMTFSRRNEVKKTAITIIPIVKETIKFLRASLPAMVEIQHKIEVEESVIWGDPTQIHQILMNLCTNAAHAMENGGVLEIKIDEINIDSELTGKDNFQGLLPGDYVFIEVKDSGHGIKKEHIERLFEPFFTTKPRGEGTGMGLAVVHGVVTELDGHIFVESVVGKGSCFSVLIPRFKGEYVDFDMTRHTTGKGKGRILFVDDEIGFLKSGAEILSEHGYDVVTESGGKEALEILASSEHHFELVVTDMVMPKMTGLELAKRIKAIIPDLPIILCTGFSNSINGNTRKEFGIDQVVMKPVLANELLAAIEHTIHSGKAG